MAKVLLHKAFSKIDLCMLQNFNRLGAKIDIKNNKAIIEGKTNFIGAELMSTDLRASVALSFSCN